MDASAVELLVLATSAWLEVASLRKQAHKEESAEAAGEKAESCAAAAQRASPLRSICGARSKTHCSRSRAGSGCTCRGGATCSRGPS